MLIPPDGNPNPCPWLNCCPWGLSSPVISQVRLLLGSFNSSQALTTFAYLSLAFGSSVFLSGWYFSDLFLNAFLISWSDADWDTPSTLQGLGIFAQTYTTPRRQMRARIRLITFIVRVKLLYWVIRPSLFLLQYLIIDQQVLLQSNNTIPETINKLSGLFQSLSVFFAIRDIRRSYIVFLFREWVIGSLRQVQLRETSLDCRLMLSELRAVVSWLWRPKWGSRCWDELPFSKYVFSRKVGSGFMDYQWRSIIDILLDFLRGLSPNTCLSLMMLSRHSSIWSLAVIWFLSLDSSTPMILLKLSLSSARDFWVLSTDLMFFRQSEMYLISPSFSLTLFTRFLCWTATSLASLITPSGLCQRMVFRLSFICLFPRSQISLAFFVICYWVLAISPCTSLSQDSKASSSFSRDSTKEESWGFFCIISSNCWYNSRNSEISFLRLMQMGWFLMQEANRETFMDEHINRSSVIASPYSFPNWQIQYLRFLFFLLPQY